MKDFIESFTCGLILLDEKFAVSCFNGAGSNFLRGVCTLRGGMPFHELFGALKDMAADGSHGEIELLTEYMRAFEECTVDYRRFDQSHYRISVKSGGLPQTQTTQTVLVIVDISDITESERFFRRMSKNFRINAERLNHA